MARLCFDDMTNMFGEDKISSYSNEEKALFSDLKDNSYSDGSSISKSKENEETTISSSAKIIDVKTEFPNIVETNEFCSTEFLSIKNEISNSSENNFVESAFNEHEIKTHQTPKIAEVVSLGNLDSSANPLELSTINKKDISFKIEDMDTVEISSLNNSEDNVQQLYECPSCTKCFTVEQNLEQHILMHSKRQKLSKIHECDKCARQFKMKHHLQRHLLCHTQEKSFRCAVCDKSYRDKHDLAVHVSNHHAKQKCDDCKMVLDNRMELRKHMLVHKPVTISKPDWMCHICEKEFKGKRYLKRHLLAHAKITPFACDKCDKAFVNKWLLDEHSIVHSGEKLFSCDECNKTFSTKSNLVRHKNSHFLTHTCSFCAATFNSKELFKDHRRTCKLVYQCGKCKLVFKKCSNLKRHLKTHTKNLAVDELTKSNIESENAIVRFL